MGGSEQLCPRPFIHFGYFLKENGFSDCLKATSELCLKILWDSLLKFTDFFFAVGKLFLILGNNSANIYLFKVGKKVVDTL